ncbi:TPA: hypothetical protein ACGO5G_001323 [Streptococcus suis]
MGLTKAFTAEFTTGNSAPFEKVKNNNEKDNKRKTEIAINNLENLFITPPTRYNKTRVSNDNLVHYGE